QSPGIDTEPVYAPDGRSIYFVSDRGGAPQIYRMAATGGNPERVTFTGSYNISPAISPDGKWLAYISRINGVFKLQVMELGGGTGLPLTTGTVEDKTTKGAPPGGGQRAVTPVTSTGADGTTAGPANVARLIYFAYDSYVIKPEFQSLLQAHAQFLKANGARHV